MPAQRTQSSHRSAHSPSNRSRSNNASPVQYPYSCNACRRRKIRCDKQQPCGYCAKINAECTYASGPTQHRPEARRRRHNTAAARSANSDSVNGPPAYVQGLESHIHDLEARVRRLEDRGGDGLGSFSRSTSPDRPSEQRPEDGAAALGSTSARRLWEVIDTEEDADIDQQPSVHQESSESLLGASGPDIPTNPKPEPLFGLTADSRSAVTAHLNLSPDLLVELVEIYKSNVHPLVPILNAPDALQAVSDPTLSQHSRNEAQTLLLAICYAALNSLQQNPHPFPHIPSQPTDRSALVLHLRDLTNHHLFGPNSHLLQTPALATLQALMLYILAGRREFPPTYTLSLTSVLVRLATKLRYSKFLRSTDATADPDGRRKNALWLQIVMLDTHVAEANNIDPLITASESELQQLLLEAHVILFTQNPSPVLNLTHPNRTALAFIQSTRLLVIRASRAVLFSPTFTHSTHSPALPTTATKIQHLTRLESELDSAVRAEHEKVTSKYYLDTHLMNLCDFTTLTSMAKMLVAKMRLAVYIVGHKTETGTGAGSCPEVAFEAFARECVGILQRSAEVAGAATAGGRDGGGGIGGRRPKYWVWMSQYLLEWDSAAILMACLARKTRTQTQQHNIDVDVCNTSDDAAERQLVQTAQLVLDDFFVRWRGRVAEAQGERWVQLRRMREKLDVLFARFRGRDTTDTNANGIGNELGVGVGGEVGGEVGLEQIDWSDIPGFNDEQVLGDFDRWISTNFLEGFEVGDAMASWS